MRRVELAFTGFATAEYGVWVVMLVFGYQNGGATTAAAVAVAQLLPAGVLAPLLARAADRDDPAVVLRRGYWWQCGSLFATALLLMTGAPDLLVYVGAIVAAIAVATTRPALAALIPRLIDTDDQLTAFNVLTGCVASFSLLAGPGLAGAMIALGGAGSAIGGFATCVGGAALLTSASTSAADSLPCASENQPSEALTAAGGALRAMRSRRELGALVAMLGGEYLTIGMLDVLVVVLAIRVLGLGAAGAGYLNAALGGGAVTGSVTAIWLIGRRRLASPVIVAAAVWASTLGILGAWPTALGAFLLLGALGTARSLLEVSDRTMLLRAAPPAARGRLFGMLESVATVGLAIGSMLAPMLVIVGGAAGGLIISASLLAVIALTTAPGLRRLDEADCIREHGRDRACRSTVE